MSRRVKTPVNPNGHCGICGNSTYFKKRLCDKHEQEYYQEKNEKATTTLTSFITKQCIILQSN